MIVNVLNSESQVSSNEVLVAMSDEVKYAEELEEEKLMTEKVNNSKHYINLKINKNSNQSIAVFL